ncbi:MAG: hypothetical protein NXH75_08085 [Halobacteriovoraceae bacterium]|nr:hypothetical protein [Halobacteriovoraceae bacterium]
MKLLTTLVAMTMVMTAHANFFSNGTRVTESKLDVIVLVDYSGSMAAFQTKGDMVKNLIKGLKYNSMNIGLIVNGPLQQGDKLFRTTPVFGDLDKVLDGLVADIDTLGSNGPATEEFYSSILKTTEAQYSDFYRTGADVKFIVVTDEDEDSNTGMNTFDFIREIKGRLDLGKVSMDLLTPTGECRSDWAGELNAMTLYQGVQSLGGTVYDLCSAK